MTNQYKIQSEPDGTYSIYKANAGGSWDMVEWGLDSSNAANEALYLIKGDSNEYKI